MMKNKNRSFRKKLSEVAEIPIARIGPGMTSTFYSSESWEDLGARPEMVHALQELGIMRPSHIQAAAFRAFNSSAPHIALADHAGSGKTLAYLVPLLQALKREEEMLGGPSTVPHCPRFVVVAPTSELCVQVLRVCRALSKTLKFRSGAFTGGRPLRTQIEMLENGLDIAIGTPGRLAELVAGGALHLDRCAAIVFDEVDVLLGDTSLFQEHVIPLLDNLPNTSKCILVSATLPTETYSALELRFPGVVAALGPGLHRTAPGLTERIIDCSGGDDVSIESGNQRKSVALFAALQEHRCPRTIVFCNKIETCRVVENFLLRIYDDDDRPIILPYHAAIRPDMREANLSKFLSSPSKKKSRNGKQRSKTPDASTNASERMILICTDRASRGIDSAFVDHVVLFDFPRDPSEYVRRVGRTARGAGGEGIVTILVLGRQVRLAKDVVGRNQKDLPVHPIPATLPISSNEQKRSSDMERFAEDLRRAIDKKD